MIGRDVVLGLRAFHEARPLARGETKHLAISDDENLLVVAFLRMGGESRPWGIAYGNPGEKPRILSVPEGRNRDLVADMCAEFAPVLLTHLQTPGYVPEDPTSWEDLRPVQQIWLPNPSHLEMLHHLAYAYTFTRWGAGARGRLNALGRASGWLFREAQRPGQQHVIVATDALRESYTFPSQEVRQGHLGFLLAWLNDEGDRPERIRAAAEAERSAVSTSLEPRLERDGISRPLEKWAEARVAGDGSRMERNEALIRKVLEPELARRFELTCVAIETLRNDQRRTNIGVDVLTREGLKEQWFQYIRLELQSDDAQDGPAFVASPETDRYPAAAGSRYQVHLASADLLDSVLLHDDAEMQTEAVAHGDAFRGTIIAIRDEGEGRATRPVWAIEDPLPGQLKLRVGNWVCVVGMPKRTGEIRLIRNEEDGKRVFEVEITGWKTRPRGPEGASIPAANDPCLVGREVGIVKNSAEGINRRKSQRIWSADVPGGWLTHSRPAGPRAFVVHEAAEDLAAIKPITDE